MDAKALLDKFLNSGMATGVLAGGLGASILGGSGLGRNLLKVGGVALVGTLAYQAWQRSKQQQSQLPPGQQNQGGIGGALGGMLSQIPGVGDLLQQAEQNPPPASSGFGGQNEGTGLAIMTAMVMAAKADGHIDAAESKHIFQHMDQAGLAGDEKAFVMNLLAQPLDIDAVARLGTSPEIAAQLYTASALAMADLNPAEQAYLDKLASRMHLDPQFVRELHTEMAAMKRG